jgi:hypothetical protein
VAGDGEPVADAHHCITAGRSIPGQSLSGAVGTQPGTHLAKCWKHVYGSGVEILVKLYVLLPKKSDNGTWAIWSTDQSGAL